MRQQLVAAALVAAGFVAGCAKKEAPAPAPAPPPAVVEAPTAVPTPAALAVGNVTLGNAIGADKKVAAPAESFKPNDTIYASILTEGAASNVALGVRWSYEDGQVVNESKQTIAPTGPAATEFHISKPDGLPAGKYKIEVSANDQPATTKQFTVTN